MKKQASIILFKWYNKLSREITKGEKLILYLWRNEIFNKENEQVIESNTEDKNSKIVEKKSSAYKTIVRLLVMILTLNIILVGKETINVIQTIKTIEMKKAENEFKQRIKGHLTDSII